MVNKKKSLFHKLSKIGFYPSHVAEIGVYHPNTSKVSEYIDRDIRCTLVEPDPQSIQLIKDQFKNKKNITLHEIAVYDYCGDIELVQKNASTFVSSVLNSPSIVNDKSIVNKEDKFIVQSKTFDQIDDGTIDLLCVDIEGCEWYVLKNMESRPDFMALETHGGIYINPYINNILEWISKNNYEIYYKTNTDTIFVKKGKYKISFKDKFFLKIDNLFISVRRIRKKIKYSLLA